jgi:hypothetical protein
MVDLPDGQKILIGNLPAGTVIEIATWQGTGRPDSRTTRLMLGVANSEPSKVAENEKTPELSQASKKNSAAGTWLAKLRIPNLPKLLIVAPLFKRAETSDESKAKRKRPTLFSRSRKIETEPEISQAASEWLESIRSTASLEPKSRTVKKVARTQKTPIKQKKATPAKPKARKTSK